LKGKTQFLLAD